MVSNHQYQNVILTWHLAPLEECARQIIVAKKVLKIYMITYIAS